MRYRQPRSVDADRGASAVELALLAPFIVALMVGTIQLAFMFLTSQDLEAAARHGARFASDEDTRTTEEITERTLAALEDTTEVTVTVDPASAQPCDGREGLPVTVTVSATAELDLLFVATVPVDLTGSASFVCSNNRSAAAAPTASVTPTPPPTPDATCLVPTFVGTKKKSATSAWTAAGFEGTISFGSGRGNYTIGSQSRTAGATADCDSDIEVGP